MNIAYGQQKEWSMLSMTDQFKATLMVCSGNATLYSSRRKRKVSKVHLSGQSCLILFLLHHFLLSLIKSLIMVI